MILIVAYCLIKNFKRLKNREYIPIFALMVMGTIATIIQNIKTYFKDKVDFKKRFNDWNNNE